MFNFPHLGSGEPDKLKSAELHQDFLKSVAKSCFHFLEPEGELHITVKKGEPYKSWKVSKTVEMTKMFKLKRGIPFFPSLYPGYQRLFSESFELCFENVLF